MPIARIVTPDDFEDIYDLGPIAWVVLAAFLIAAFTFIWRNRR